MAMQAPVEPGMHARAGLGERRGHLSDTAAAGHLNLPAALTRVMGQGGPGAWRQLLQILRLLAGRSGISIDEYYSYALWRRGEGAVLRRELLPAARFRAFNDALRIPGRGPSDAVVEDKLATEAILAARGLPVTQTRAAFPGTGGDAMPDSVRRLVGRDALAAFLADPGDLPLFGKPRAGSLALGSAAITGAASDGSAVTFLNGRTAPVGELADEIVHDWPGGYVFQPFYQCAAALRRHVGPAMASVRITTLRTDRGIEPWYAVLRIPAKAAMHDGDAFSTRVWGLVDPASGAIVRLRNLKDAATPDVTHWLDPDVPLLGLVLPHWPQAMAAVVAAHDSFPGHGILGWDVFLTDDGALINEVNANPGHVYQAAAARGLRNADMMPLYNRALAHARAASRAA